ncbi:hypothetical protein BGX27_006191 [Mortierella sp. AM989]|nr:hypothetical protein BGX27_006191 [Mortierella sp. AM989]
MSNPSQDPEALLLDTVRAWISRRDEFFYLDLEDDEDNSRLARNIVHAATPGIHPGKERRQVAELMSKCLSRLLSEGAVEFKSMDQMILRVVKTPAVATAKAPLVMIDLDMDEVMHEVTVLDSD